MSHFVFYPCGALAIPFEIQVVIKLYFCKCSRGIGESNIPGQKKKKNNMQYLCDKFLCATKNKMELKVLKFFTYPDGQ